jgi:hypothetical protein
MKDYVKISAFAKELGLTRIAVFKAGQRGTFPMEQIEGNWQVDKNNEDVKAYIEAVRERQNKPVELPVLKQPKKAKPVKVKKEKQPKTTKPVKVKKPKKQPKKKQGKEDTVQKPEDLPYDIYERLNSGESLTNVEIVNLPKAWVEKIKIYESTKQIVQKRQQERKELISKKSYRFTLNRLFEIHQNQFITIKSKIISDIAAVFGSTDDAKKIKAEEILDNELWEVLFTIKKEFNKSLDKIQADKIE